jgi:hypothetical protein
MKLNANLNWKANQGILLPEVSVNLKIQNKFINIFFEVNEPKSCFCLQHNKDNAPCYEDSCVELFLMNDSNEYLNFEFNALGFCLAAKGKDRFNRVSLRLEELQLLKRRSSMQQKEIFLSWNLDVSIPLAFFRNSQKLIGNIYKCADMAETPHYLSLFPIDTEKPDFHRPEFFREIFTDK